LEKTRSILEKMKTKDILLYYPYHSFDYFLDLLREAAIDPNVSHIRCTLYRVASNSHVIKSLITALHNGKDVTVFIELRARFDEEANIDWATILRDAGARVITGISGLKVHSKVMFNNAQRKRSLNILWLYWHRKPARKNSAHLYRCTIVYVQSNHNERSSTNIFIF
jgi:polyphosphate kinase